MRRKEVRRRGRKGKNKQRWQVKMEGERKDGNMHESYSHMYMNINLYACKIQTDIHIYIHSNIKDGVFVLV